MVPGQRPIAPPGRGVKFVRSHPVAAGLGLGLLAWVVVGSGGPGTTHVVTRAAVLGVTLFTARSCAGTAARRQGGARWAWALLGFSAGCWFLASAIAAFHELTGPRRLPLPVPPGAGTAVPAVLVPVALAILLAPALRGAARAQTALDVALVATSLVFAGGALGVEVLPPSAKGVPGQALVLAAPLGDVLVGALVVAAAARLRLTGHPPWGPLFAGLGLVTVGHRSFLHPELLGRHVPAATGEVCWLVGALLVGLAAGASGRGPLRLPERRAGGTITTLLPHVPVLAAGAVLFARHRDGGVPVVLAASGAMVAGLVLVRQLLLESEKRGLAGAVEAGGRHAAELERDRRRLGSLAHNSLDVLTIVDSGNVIRYLSAAAERVLGFRPGELVGTHLDELLHPDERRDTLVQLRAAPPPPAAPLVFQRRLRRKNGSWCLAEIGVSNLLADDAVGGFLLASRDLTERRALEDQLRHQALHDPLTSLGNRALFTDRLEHAVSRCRRNPEVLALLTIDLDGFKQVNDTLGHAAGDRLLEEIARRLVDCVRVGDTVARMGGDEFAVLIERADGEGPTVVAQRILYHLRRPIELERRSIVIQGSIGVAVGSTSAFSAEDLMRNADLAMYVAKSRGKGLYEVYEPGMRAAALQRVELESDFRGALHRKELVLHYQPVVDLSTGRISGAEALVRWLHPLRGLLPPGQFVPVVEESDLVMPLGRWVLEEACRQAVRCRQQLPADSDFTMSVNVAARQLTSPWLVKEVRETLEQHSLDPTALLLEITEGALMDGSEGGRILDTLQQLRDLGVRIAIDDFGIGWSSLSRLRSFPVDKLKIDRSFVREVTAADDDAPIVSAIVAMAQTLRLSTVAEGVETPEQLLCLQHHGCEEVQGFLLARPLAGPAFEALLGGTPDLLVAAAAVECPGAPRPSTGTEPQPTVKVS